MLSTVHLRKRQLSSRKRACLGWYGVLLHNRSLHYRGQSDRSAICGRDEIGYTFQQDNARPYTSRVAKDYLQNEGIDTFKMKLLMQCLDPQNPLI